jgi:hypothetical protein
MMIYQLEKQMSNLIYGRFSGNCLPMKEKELRERVLQSGPVTEERGWELATLKETLSQPRELQHTVHPLEGCLIGHEA